MFSDMIAHVVEPSEKAIRRLHRRRLRHARQGESAPPLSPEITHFIGSIGFPIKTSQHNSVYIAHFPDNHKVHSPTNPEQKLTVLHVGTNEPPNMSLYSKTCTSIEFTGNISSVNALFEIPFQLPRVEDVTISIGSLQQYYILERDTIIAWRPSVKRLKISLDLEFFNGLQHQDCDVSDEDSEDGCDGEDCMSDMQASLLNMVQAILYHVNYCFPSLEDLVVELPENETLDEVIQSLIRGMSGLRNKTLEEVRQGPSVGKKNVDMECE